MSDRPTETEQLVAAQLLQIALEKDDRFLIEARLNSDENNYVVDAYIDILQLLVHKRAELSEREQSDREGYESL